MSRHVEQSALTKQRRSFYPHLSLNKRQSLAISWMLLIVTPLIAFTIVEYLNYNNPWTDFTPAQVILNLVFYYLGELFFYYIRGRMSGAIKFCIGISWGWGISNHYLLMFRGRSLLPSDFLSLGTAANVAGTFNFTPDGMQVLTGVIVLVFILAVSLLPKEERKPFPWKIFLPATAGTVVFLGIFFGTSFLERLNIEPSLWTTRGNGWVLNFAVCLKYSAVEKPENYSDNVLNGLAAETPSESISATATVDGEQPVNLIVIMNESYSDLSVLPGVETNQDAMPFYRSLTEDTIKGYAYSSVFGGTTANSEYEFLSGNTTAFLPPTTVAYQMFVQDGDPTLVAQMKALGYRCVASHPYRSSGWNRIPVYRGFGFDEWYFEPDFQDRVYIRGDESTGYVSDLSNYENLIRMYEEKEPGEKLFHFNITMQNHSAYTMAWDGLERAVWLTGEMEGRFSTVNQYLSLIYESDRALEYLISYFEQVEEPTMILMFGDHQPQVATNFYTDVLGEEPDMATAQKKQMVPFVLWANYDIPEAEGVELSLNYLSTLLMDTANLPLTGYQQFLQQVQEQVPVINAVGLRDADGVWYSLDDPMPEELAAALEEYQILQYNNVVDRRDRVEDFFTLAE